MQKYLIFIDVDDTLVPIGKDNMDEKISKVFEEIQNKGHIVSITTGRSLESIYKIKGIDKAKYISGLMGCTIVDGKTKKSIVEPMPMDKEVVKNFIKDISNAGYKWTYKDDYAEKTACNDDELLNKYCAKLVSKSEQDKDIQEGKIIQMLVHGNLSQDIRDKYNCFDFYNISGYFDVTIKGISKARAVENLKKLHPDYITVAIGDSNNDLPMFNCCDIKIAMGNAKDSVKQISDYITKSVDECGVYYAIKEILKL